MEGQPTANRKVLLAVVASVSFPLSLCAGAYAWLEDLHYGGFPSRHEVRQFLAAYPKINSDTTRVHRLKLLLWRMRAPEDSKEEAIAGDALRQLAAYYLSSHDASVLKAVEQTDALGYFAYSICSSFYERIVGDDVYLARLRSNAVARESLCECIGVNFSNEQMERILAAKPGLAPKSATLLPALGNGVISSEIEYHANTGAGGFER